MFHYYHTPAILNDVSDNISPSAPFPTLVGRYKGIQHLEELAYHIE